MSALLIRQALEVALATLSPPLATQWENTPYTPSHVGDPPVLVPYQQVYLLLAQPVDIEMSGKVHREEGFLHINLNYPLDAGAADAATRAELIRATFYRGRSFAASGVSVTVDHHPEVAPAHFEDDRYVVPVRIRFYSHITRS